MKRILHTFLATLFIYSALANDTTMEYTYVGDEPIVYYGTRRSETYDLAIVLNNSTLIGKRITAIRAQVNSPAQEIDNCSVWLSSELLLEKNENGKKINAPNILSQAATLSEDGWIEATLDTPYTLTDTPIYVGYSFTNTNFNEDNRGPIAYSQNRHSGGFYIHTSMTVIKWKDYEETLKGVLPVYITIEGDFGENQVGLGGYATAYPYTQVDIQSALPFYIYNIGSNEVHSIDYSYEIEGTSRSNHIDFTTPLSIDITNPHTVKLPIEPIATLGSHTLSLSIDQVNGMPNKATKAAADLPIEVKQLVPVHRTVLEEGTGSWCSACPRGAVAMKELHRLYPENFIGLAYHSKDPMMTMAMDDIPVDFPHFPSAYINRGELVDPYYGSDKSQNDDFAIEPLIVADFTQPTIAAIDVTSEWTDENRSAIDAQATVAFTCNIAEHEYRVSFVLVNNGLCGEGNGWSQVNSLGKNTQDNVHPLLRPLVDAGSPIEGYIYDDVVILSKEPYGIEGSLPNSMNAFEWHKVNYHIDLADVKSIFSPNDDLIQNKDNIELVAMLIDSETGMIVNAAKAHIGHTSGKKQVENNATKIATEYYDLQGMRVKKPFCGIYIVIDRYENGTIKAYKTLIR